MEQIVGVIGGSGLYELDGRLRACPDWEIALRHGRAR